MNFTDIGSSAFSNFFLAEGNILILNGKLVRNDSGKIIIHIKDDINKNEPKFLLNDEIMTIFYKSDSNIVFNYEEVNDFPVIKKEISENSDDNNNNKQGLKNKNNLNISLNFLSHNEENQNQLEEISKEYYTDNASTNEMIGIISLT